MDSSHLAGALRAWFDRTRRDLPWRLSGPPGRRAPYATWVAEVMLQQTRVEAAAPYYERFLARFPDPAALAAASEAELLRAWAGLGYYRRARLLQAAARVIVAAGGRLPARAAEWMDLPGIGVYTAAAIAALSADEPVAAVDGNVRRVAARMLRLDLAADAAELQRRAEAWALDLVRAGGAPGATVEALMELGATVCTPRAPRCPVCPWSDACLARASGSAERLPRSRARPAWREVELVGFVAQRGAGWLLRERASGWNPGLWEPPTAPARAGEGPAAAWRRLGCGAAQGFADLGSVRHTITRHRIRARVFAVRGWRGGPRAVRDESVGLTGLGRKMLRLRAAALAPA